MPRSSTKSKLESVTESLNEVVSPEKPEQPQQTTPINPSPVGSNTAPQAIATFTPSDYTATNLFSDSSRINFCSLIACIEADTISAYLTVLKFLPSSSITASGKTTSTS